MTEFTRASQLATSTAAAVMTFALALSANESAFAESEAVCNQYANDAVAAQRANVRREGCNLQGPAWSENWGNHFGWCRGQSAEVVASESKKRMDNLTECTQRPAYCRTYANAAISAQNVNASVPACNKQGPRWSTNFQAHYGWCLAVGRATAEAEHNAREAEVRDCSFRGAPPSPGTFGGVYIEGIELVRDAPSGPGSVPLASNPTFLSQASLCGQWTANRARVNEQINALARGRRLAEGISVHSASHSEVTGSCTARAEMINNNITVQIKLPGNRFFAQLTQPTFVGSYADPQISVDYDIEATVSIRIPANAGQPLPVTLNARVVNIRPDSQNFTADVAKAVANLIDVFTGGEISAMIPKELPFQRSVEGSLGPIASAIPAGYRLETYPTQGRPTMTLLATKDAPYYPPVR
jgi:hypothetical protein